MANEKPLKPMEIARSPRHNAKCELNAMLGLVQRQREVVLDAVDSLFAVGQAVIGGGQSGESDAENYSSSVVTTDAHVRAAAACASRTVWQVDGRVLGAGRAGAKG